MESQRQKWVAISYLVAAGLLSYLVFEFCFWISGVYDLEARFHNIDLIIRLTSVGIGALTFLFLYRHERTNQYMHEVVAELSRVTWPTHQDTVRTTIVVMIMVLISGLFLGGMDALWTWALKWII